MGPQLEGRSEVKKDFYDDRSSCMLECFDETRERGKNNWDPRSFE